MHQASYYRWLVLSKYLKATIPPTSVLDVGCDDGYFLSQISARIKAGIDPAPPPRRSQHHPVIRANGLHIPFRAGSFDTVLALDVLEHVEDDEALLNALMDTVRVGGRLWLSAPCANFRIFPGFVTARAERGWGHVRRGYSADGLTSKLPLSVEVATTYWNEPFYRIAYVALRVIRTFSPAVARWLSACCARLDNLARDGNAGHVYLEIRKL